MKFNESYYNPFGHAASYYYGRNLRKQVAKAKLEGEPGTYFNYQSGQTQVLGLALERRPKREANYDIFAREAVDSTRNGIRCFLEFRS